MILTITGLVVRLNSRLSTPVCCAGIVSAPPGKIDWMTDISFSM